MQKKQIAGGLGWRRMFTGLALIGATMAAAAASEAPVVPIPIERFFQRPAVLEAKLSPSGKQLAVTTSRGATRIGLVVINLVGGEASAMRAVSFSDADITQFDWVGENRLVFSVHDLQAGGGEDRRYAPGLYAVNPDGKDLRQLVRRQGTPFVSNGTSLSRALEWNHLLLHVPLQQDGVTPEEVVVGKMNFGRDQIVSIVPIWLNTRSGRTRSIELNSPPHTVSWMFDSKGEARVAATLDQGRQALHWRGPGESKWRQLAESDVLSAPFIPSAVDDAGNLYVSSSDGPEGYAVLSRFDFEKGVPLTPALVTTPGFDFSGSLVMDRAGARALGVRVDTDGEQTVWFDAGMKRMQALADEGLPGRTNRLSCRRCGAEDMVVLVRSFSDREPGRLYLYEAETQRWQLVSRVLDDIDAQQMAMVDLHRIKARDGRDLPVWLTQPAGSKAGQPLPAVVLVHGGPWVRGGHWQWDAMEQFLASRGYLVISPEFRGSTGYGGAHFHAGWKQWGQAMQDDVADALLWAQKQGLASDKACIAGASYGGYSTLMGLIKQPELYRCGVAWVAVTDPFLLLEGSWWVDDDSNGLVRKHMLPQLVGDADQDAEMLKVNSPLVQAKQIKAPLLLAFGESDKRVPLVHGTRLRAALTEAGRPPEWVTYENESHSWRKVETHVDFARRVEKFLGQHLKADKP
ncbi:prolyl oligopeptidase family serine peptidase [Paucibacter sp. TC2R-5]|uniref:S9 family peptidase n=1 Tax=Paucibacter sp. TC2R-5 TaxID=2893555 RepID=UPI0021E4FF56|nr:prolyl oligopeptidase family serine peptidase [Paucibacter sp. TC2R-5]MCV2358444.1 prolyl oligopeptidase family serine peptidase [Paucibacter sp. TC2R-5]